MRMVFEENLTGIQQALDDQVPIDCQLPDVNGEHDYIEDIPGMEWSQLTLSSFTDVLLPII